MDKTCNLGTVKNTPSEARRSTSQVDYYYIDFCDNCQAFNQITSVSLSRIMGAIYDYLDERDIYYIEKMYICAWMLDGFTRRVFEISIDDSERHMHVSRVR